MLPLKLFSFLRLFLTTLVSWDPAGLVWHGKRPKAGNGKNMGIEMENGPKLGRGKNGKKMAQKWIFEGVFHYFSQEDKRAVS